MTNDDEAHIITACCLQNDVETLSRFLPLTAAHKEAKFQLVAFEMILPKTNLTLMHIAASGDSLEAFIMLERAGLPIDIPSANSYLPIHYACQLGAYEVACYILSRNPSLAKVEPQVEFHLLYLAATGGDAGIMEVLFENGVNPRSPANRRNNPILKAVQSRNRDCLYQLLRHGETPPKNDDYSFPMQAVINLQPAAVEFLLEFDDHPINYCSPVNHQTLLGLCCFTGLSFKSVILSLLQKVDNVEPPGEYECQGPVHWICTIIDVGVCKEFLKHNIRVNRLDSDGKTGFHYMVDKDKKKEADIMEIMKLLIEYGFDINIRRAPRPNTMQAPSVLEQFILSIQKSYPIIEFLVKNGADIYAIDKSGNKLADTIMKKTDKKLQEIFKKSPLYKPPPS